MTSHPYASFAATLWAISLLAAISGLAVWRRRRGPSLQSRQAKASEGSDAQADVSQAEADNGAPEAPEDSEKRPFSPLRPEAYLLLVGLLLALVGVGVFFLQPAPTASVSDPSIFPSPSFYISPDASPLVLPAAPALTDSSSPEANGAPATSLPQTADGPPSDRVYDLGFGHIGPVEIGDPDSKVETAFGKATSKRPEDTPGGKEAVAYVYEERNRSFVVYTSQGKVFYYVVASAGFKTVSGVEVGDSIEKLRQVYGDRLLEGDGRSSTRASREGQYFHLRGGDRVVRFLTDGSKIVRIEGGSSGG